MNNFVEQYTRLATEEQRENFLVGYNNDNEEPFNDDEVDILLRDLHSTSEPFFKVAIINCLARNSNSFFVKFSKYSNAQITKSEISSVIVPNTP